eukprot:scaffold3601_cov101-Isochrysis_galbana.AAC.2
MAPLGGVDVERGWTWAVPTAKITTLWWFWRRLLIFIGSCDCVSMVKKNQTPADGTTLPGARPESWKASLWAGAGRGMASQ